MVVNTLRNVFAAGAMALPVTALSHEGHSNTPLHAILHMLEQSGAAIFLMLVVGVGTLVWRAQQKRAQQNRPLQKQLKPGKEQDHDSR